jgi:hypothetical protein
MEILLGLLTPSARAHGELCGHSAVVKPISGKLSAPFILMNGHVGDRKEGSAFLFLVDSKGQIRWAHFPPPLPASDDPRTRTLIVKPLSRGQIGVLQVYETSSFSLVDLDHKVTPKINLDTASQRGLPFHHDFEVMSDKLLTLTHSVGYFRKWWKFWAPPMSFLGNPFLEVDLKTGSMETGFDYLDLGDPYYEPDWTFNEKDTGNFWFRWKEPFASNNFVHANSIFHSAGKGYLLSLRSLNKLVLLDASRKKILWTMGPSPKNTYSTQGTNFEFRRQHHATFLRNGNILLFDNNKQNQSRVLEIAIDESSKKAALVRAFVPMPALSSPRHGSAFELRNGNILTYFPNTTHDPNPNFLVEFERNSGKEVGRMLVDIGFNGAGYRAIPWENLAGEISGAALKNLSVSCPTKQK